MDEATQICYVPVVGEAICFCDMHVRISQKDSPTTKWYPLTPEEAAVEEKVGESIKKFFASFSKKNG